MKKNSLCYYNFYLRRFFVCFSPDLLDLVCAYNMSLHQRLALLGDKVAFLDWEGVFSQEKDYLYR